MGEVTGEFPHERIEVRQVSALREHGLTEARQAKVAYLEPDGSISVVPMGERPVRSRRRVRTEMQESPCFRAKLVPRGADRLSLRKRILTRMARI